MITLSSYKYKECTASPEIWQNIRWVMQNRCSVTKEGEERGQIGNFCQILALPWGPVVPACVIVYEAPKVWLTVTCSDSMTQMPRNETIAAVILFFVFSPDMVLLGGSSSHNSLMGFHPVYSIHPVHPTFCSKAHQPIPIASLTIFTGIHATL